MEDISKNPNCPHGPTIQYLQIKNDGTQPKEFLACSAFRSKNECTQFDNQSTGGVNNEELQLENYNKKITENLLFIKKVYLQLNLRLHTF